MTGILLSGCSTNFNNDDAPRLCSSTIETALTLDIRVIAVSDIAKRADRAMRTITAPTMMASALEKLWLDKCVAASIWLRAPAGPVLAGRRPVGRAPSVGRSVPVVCTYRIGGARDLRSQRGLPVGWRGLPVD